ncbi:MAG: DNA translocase FtsK 4TM domain-containing protein [Verrucomicrobiaceae bacterium]|nr:DNA translocase FtsK 4TM domain-containing protein [Verrucomicrobiaceae bacterium]
MGIVGAVLAGYSLFFVGLAAYLVPVAVTWFGVCKLHSKTRLTRIGWMGVAVLTVSAAALLQTLGLFEQNVEVTRAVAAWWAG